MKIINSKEIAKYNRLDPDFHLQIKSDVNEFLRTHTVNTRGDIKPLLKRKKSVPKNLSKDNYLLLYNLIRYYKAFRKVSNNIKEIQSSINFED